jgi:hypothetical protein
LLNGDDSGVDRVVGIKWRTRVEALQDVKFGFLSSTELCANPPYFQLADPGPGTCLGTFLERRNARPQLRFLSIFGISKQGDRYLRRVLVVGAHSVLRRAKQNPEKYPWLTQLLARRPFKVVAIALANKMARIAWALLANGTLRRAGYVEAAGFSSLTKRLKWCKSRRALEGNDFIFAAIAGAV